MSYFPESKRNFKIENIYNDKSHGWETKRFTERVFNKGPTLIVLKTSEGAICGGYTSKNWDGSGKFTDDIDAFVFNMTHKYIPNDSQNAIYTYSDGFCFGASILLLTSDTKLNQHDEGRCTTGKHHGYDIEGDVSPLTNENFSFTCAQLEVYKVIYS
jgi:hypothetical protein